MKKIIIVSLVIIVALTCIVSCDGNVSKQDKVSPFTPIIIPVESVSLNTTFAELNLGKMYNLVATVSPTNATNKSVIWETNDSSIATVENGIVTGVSEGTATITVKTKDGNKIATCTVYVINPIYLTFTASSNSITVTPHDDWNATTREYSTDNGDTWNSYSSGQVGTTTGSIMFRGLGGDKCSDSSGWSVTGSNVVVSGDIMTLLDYRNPKEAEMDDACFYNMFEDCDSLVNASDLILSATTLTNGCYAYMFDGCNNLMAAPALPATTLALRCYYEMFYGCTSLTSIGLIGNGSAVTLAIDYSTNYGCMREMFRGCSSLKITTATNGTKFFSCPSNAGTGSYSNAVKDMFKGTIGGIETPTSNTDYYWYIDD